MVFKVRTFGKPSGYDVCVAGRGNTGLRGQIVTRDVEPKDVGAVIEASVKELEERLDSPRLIP